MSCEEGIKRKINKAIKNILKKTTSKSLCSFLNMHAINYSLFVMGFSSNI